MGFNSGFKGLTDMWLGKIAHEYGLRQYKKLLNLYALYTSRTTLCFQRYEVTERALRIVTLFMECTLCYNILFYIPCLISSGKDFDVTTLPCAS